MLRKWLRCRSQGTKKAFKSPVLVRRWSETGQGWGRAAIGIQGNVSRRERRGHSCLEV